MPRWRAAGRSRAAAPPATPVIRSTRSGQYAVNRRPDRRRTRWSVPRMYASSTRPSRIAMCSSPLASARSVPGSGCRCRYAPAAVACGAGPPRCAGRRPPDRRRSTASTAACVSAGLPPTSSTVCASAMSASGNGSPRSMPSARLARGGRRRHAEPAVVVDRRGAQRDPDELAQRVRLLVGQPAAAERADAVRSVALLAELDRGGDQRSSASSQEASPQRAAPVAGVLADQRA